MGRTCVDGVCVAVGVDSGGVDSGGPGLDASSQLPDAGVDAGYDAGSDGGPPPSCGDGVRGGSEACDDGNTSPGDGCDTDCQAEPGFECTGFGPGTCASICGDMMVVGDEVCDDGNTTACGECNTDCTGVGTGATCGDGSICSDSEICDDMNTAGGDGCAADCSMVETGWVCGGEPSVCADTCGNGTLQAGEGCDDGATVDGDGCSAACEVEPGYECAGAPSVCGAVCGDGLIIRGLEDCDDSNVLSGDGCSADCTPEIEWSCAGEPSVCGRIPDHRWDTIINGGAGFEQARTIAVDPDGNIIIAGPYNGSLSHGGTDYPSRGMSDVFVAKFSRMGALMWIRTFGSTLADSCRGVATDADGNIYLTGQYQGADVMIGSHALPYDTGDGKNIFVVSYSPEGAVRWARGYVGPGTDTGNDIAVYGERVYVVGHFSESVEFPVHATTANGGADAFVLYLDRAGVAQWQRSYGGTGADIAWGVTVADNRKPYITGSFQGAVTFGVLGERVAQGSRDLFIVKLSRLGEERRLHTIGALGASVTGRDVAITPMRGVVVGGLYSGSVAFLATAAPETASLTDGLVIRLDSNLTYQWHRTMPGPGSARVLNVAYGAGDQVFVTGQFTGDVTAAGFLFHSAGVDDVFVAAFQDGAGGGSVRPHWALRFGGAAQDWGWGTASSGDMLYVSGAVRGVVDFGGGAHVANADGDMFIAAYGVR